MSFKRFLIFTFSILVGLMAGRTAQLTAATAVTGRSINVLSTGGTLSESPSSNAPSATIVVTQASDAIQNDSLCSLREAVIAANTDSSFSGCPPGSGADVIEFSPALPRPITITLLATGANEDSAQTGDLDLSGQLTLYGPTPGVHDDLIIDGNGSDRVFEVLPSARVDLSNLTIQHGYPGGGAEGGGVTIGLTAVLTMTHSTVTSNQASAGSGIKVLGRLSLTNSVVTANQGGGIRNSGGLLTLNNATITNNTLGAGVYNSNRGSLAMNGGLVSGNQGGGIYNTEATATLTGVTIQNNTGSGGAHNSGTSNTVLTVAGCTIAGNSAGIGAGLSNSGIGATAYITNSRISGNTATTVGGGINNNGIITVAGSTIDQNQAASGGGINHTGGSLSLTNITISSNLAADNGGGLYNRDSATLLNVTFYHNTAGGPGTGGNLFNDEAQMNLRNTILAHATTQDNCTNSGVLPIVSLGHNLESANTCGFASAGDQVDMDPLLESLQDHGGPTPTHALMAGSPAIDHGDTAVYPATDQRGAPRPIDGDGDGTAIGDVGAYEAASAPLPPPLIVKLFLPFVIR